MRMGCTGVIAGNDAYVTFHLVPTHGYKHHYTSSDDMNLIMNGAVVFELRSIRLNIPDPQAVELVIRSHAKARSGWGLDQRVSISARLRIQTALLLLIA